jgi:hypothetical protein
LFLFLKVSMRIFLFTILIVGLSGCCRFKKDSSECIQRPLCSGEKEALGKPLYNLIPRHRDQIYWYDLGHWMSWAAFGNDDDGIFGEGRNPPFHKEEPRDLITATRWFFRNPFHNFCFYVIGAAPKPQDEFVILSLSRNKCALFTYHPKGKIPPLPERSYFHFSAHSFKPFLGFRIQWTKKVHATGYIGWREKGNFGIKLLPFKIYE